MNTRSDARDRRAATIAFAVLALLAPSTSRIARAEPAEEAVDPMAPYRERFRAAMDRYKEGAFAEAIVVWEAIYRELGPEKAYRLAFNLGRAYEAYGDVTSAAERYEAYLSEVARRQASGEALEENVIQQAAAARARLVELARGRGRIHVLATDGGPTVARIDEGEARPTPFSSLVAPGPHVVVFAPRTPHETRREITVAVGEAIDVRPPAPLVDDATRSPRPPEPARRATAPRERTPPYPLWVPLAVGGATVLSVALPVLTYRHAIDLQERHDDPSTPSSDRDALAADYDDARRTAYLSLAVPIVLAAGTAALLAGYYLGRPKSDPSAATLRFDAAPTRIGIRF